jgi:hypothetical protein
VVGAIDIGIRLRLTLLQRQQRVKQTVGMAFYTVNWLRSSLLHRAYARGEITGPCLQWQLSPFVFLDNSSGDPGSIVQVVLFQSRSSRQSVA